MSIFTPHLRPTLQATPGALLALFVGAVAIRVGYVLWLYLMLGDDGLVGADSGFYLRVARAIAATGSLVEPAAGGTWQDQTIAMPLYLVWLALLHVLAGAWAPLAAALAQAGIDAGSCVLIALIARELDEGLALPAGILAAISPTLVVLSGLIYTDSFFLFWSTLSLYAGLRWLREPSWSWAVLLGLALGLALSTRAVMLLWIPLVLTTLGLRAWWRGRRGLRSGLHLLLVLALAASIQVPLLVRNWTNYGTLSLTSQGGTHALLWLVPLVREAADGLPHAEGARLPQAMFDARSYRVDQTNPFAVSRAMGQLAAELLFALGPEPILRAWVYGAGINLASPAVLLSPPVSRLPRTGFYAMPGATKSEKIRNFLLHNDNPTYGHILMGATALSLIALALTLVGAVLALRRHPEARFLILFLVLWVAYILAVHGPVASPKYRLPAEPTLIVFLAFGLRSAVGLLPARVRLRRQHAS